MQFPSVIDAKSCEHRHAIFVVESRLRHNASKNRGGSPLPKPQTAHASIVHLGHKNPIEARWLCVELAPSELSQKSDESQLVTCEMTSRISHFGTTIDPILMVDPFIR
jgi:hypothetical protein